MVEMHHPKTVLAAFVVGTMMAFVLFFTFFEGKKTDFGDAVAFGAQTTASLAEVEGHLIHCTDRRELEDCLAGVKARNSQHSVLWLGNSQLHSVNQWKEGDTAAAAILFQALQRRGFDLMTFSQGNASLQEHYVLFEYLRQQLQVKTLILPVVFDDTREDGLRDEVASLARNETVLSALSKTEIGQRLSTVAQTIPQDEDTAGIAKTMQEHVERFLNQWLERHSELWQMRPQIRGDLLGSLYLLRNTVFGIKATSKRKSIPGRYRNNLEALEAILDTAAQSGIAVVLYIVPIRGDTEMPYVAEEYERFKSDVEALANRYSSIYANLEALVPGGLWGQKGATALGRDLELDFMHFQAGGHKLLANRLEGRVAEALKRQGSLQ
jgi:hypothetical protein